MRIRSLLVLISLIIGGMIILFNRGQIGQFWQLLGDIQLYAIALMIAVQLASYFSNAKYYASFFAISGLKVDFAKLYRISLALNFVNQVFPSGGIAGASFLSNQLSAEIPAGKATLAQLARYAFTYISFLIVLVVGFLFLFLGGPVDRLLVKVMLLLILAIIISGVVVLALLNNRRLVGRLSRKVVGWLNTSVRWVFKRRSLISNAQLELFLNEFYEGYNILISKRRQWLKPLWYCLAGNIAEVATIYVVFLAFGQLVNPGSVIAAYALANILSLSAFFSGGIGVYEGAMVAALVALGIPLTISLSVVIVYRGLNMLIFLPVGFYFYRKGLGS